MLDFKKQIGDALDEGRKKLSEEELKNDIKSLSEEEKTNLARSMATPMRCGGCCSIEGKRFIIFQGFHIPEDIFHLGYEAVRKFQIENEETKYNYLRTIKSLGDKITRSDKRKIISGEWNENE